MMQEIFRIPGLGIPVFGYGLMLVVGFYSAMQLGRALARRSGIDPDAVVNIALLALIFGIVGSRLSHVLENLGEYTRPELGVGQNLYNIVNIRSGGLTFYGGFLLATVACIIYGVRSKLPLRIGMDIIAPCVMVGLGFGRIGCFLNGCCYGAECSAPWAVNFPYHSNAYLDQYEHGELNVPTPLTTLDKDARPRLKTVDEAKAEPSSALLLSKDNRVAGKTEALPVHPSQLYSAFTAFLLAGLLVAFYTLQPAPGRVFALMLILEAPARFLLEMLRAEPPVLGPLSFSMVLSIPLFICGVVMWYAVGRISARRPPFAFEVLPTTSAGTA